MWLEKNDIVILEGISGSNKKENRTSCKCSILLPRPVFGKQHNKLAMLIHPWTIAGNKMSTSRKQKGRDQVPTKTALQVKQYVHKYTALK